MTDLAICTFLWDDNDYRWKDKYTYGVEHVEKLGRSLKRHLTVPYEYVLVTDYSPELFSEPDRVVPLWDDNRDMGGCYVRLKAFDKATGEQLGKRFMWLDLDIVITSNIDHLVDHDYDFWSWVDPNPPTPYCGSLIGMKAGARQKVWDKFDRENSKRAAKHYIGTDQAWIAHCLGRTEKKFGQEDGVYSYKKHISKKHKDGTLPSNCCMVVFHGAVDPSTEQDIWINEHWQ